MRTSAFHFILVIVLFCTGVYNSYGQWATSGINIYNANAGNVGISTNAPATLLHVAKNMTEPAITVQNLGGAGGATYSMIDNSSGANWKFKATASGGFKIRDHANGLDVITVENNSSANALYIDSSGNLGIQTASPAASLHVAEVSPGNTAIFGTSSSWYNTGTNVSIGDNNASSGLFIGQGPTNSGFLLWTYDANPANAKFKIGTLGNQLILQEVVGNVGIGLGPALAKLHLNVSGANAYAGMMITSSLSGGKSISINQGTAGKLNFSDPGVIDLVTLDFINNRVGINRTSPVSALEVYLDDDNFCLFGRPDNTLAKNWIQYDDNPAHGDGHSGLNVVRSSLYDNAGTGYSTLQSNAALSGENWEGNPYSFGIHGWTQNYGGLPQFYRTGGVLGIADFSDVWGSLGYVSSSITTYGGYFTSYTTGAGKSFTSTFSGIGMGAWGDLFGADIHGKIYGVYTEGENYALYTNGIVYKNNLDIHLQENGKGENAVMYTNVSMQATVQTCGTAILYNGKANIVYDPSFASVVSSEKPVIITVTPIGDCNGVHITEMADKGFSIAENKAGRSNITVNYIAVGQRKGHENPSLSKEVLDIEYNSKLKRGLHADADTQTDGEGLYYENGNLVVGIPPLSNAGEQNTKEDIRINR